MQIGQVIRQYRKMKNLTQEEMASRLGVTAPAVNKWENGNSFPDITLLAPIARLLDITLDTLLSFHEALTEDEIRNIVRETESVLMEKPYDEAFGWAKEKLEKYPNCEELILYVALTFDGWRLMYEVEGAVKYDELIRHWYTQALESDDEEIRTKAADSLFGFYLRKDEYEKAEQYLTYFSKQNPERKRKQAVIYSKTNRRNEAYKAYEELLFSEFQMSSVLLHSIYMLAMQDNNMEKVHMLIEKQSELARAFEMGEYYEISGRLELATAEKDVETTIDTMEKMLSSIERICDFSKSPLYEHMSFKETREEFLVTMKNHLLNCFRDEESYGFLKSDKRWQELVK